LHLNRRKLIGIFTIIASALVLAFYTYLLFLARPEIQSFTLKITVFVIMVVFMSVFIVIGLGLLKTPSIPPIRDLDDDGECTCSS